MGNVESYIARQEAHLEPGSSTNPSNGAQTTGSDGSHLPTAMTALKGTFTKGTTDLLPLTVISINIPAARLPHLRSMSPLWSTASTNINPFAFSFPFPFPFSLPSSSCSISPFPVCLLPRIIASDLACFDTRVFIMGGGGQWCGQDEAYFTRERKKVAKSSELCTYSAMDQHQEFVAIQYLASTH